MQEGSESRVLSRYTARDGLTGAFTRPYFLSLLTDEWRFALDMGKPFCVSLIDIDGLRKINEQRGLSAGDTLIADMAEGIRVALDLPQWANLRCLMGRHDGDCLILLLPGCSLKRAELFAFRMRQSISSASSMGIPFTVSIAVTAFNGKDSVDGMLARIEKTLCLAKQFGGDGVEICHTAELSRDLATVTRLPVAWHGKSEPGR